MSADMQDRERRVVPQLRPVDSASASRENPPLSEPKLKPQSESLVEKLVADWKAERTEAFAMDLVSAAWVLGLNRVALDAARFVLEQKSAPVSARDIAMLYLRDAGDPSAAADMANQQVPAAAGDLGTTSEFQKRYWVQVHRLRTQLAYYPRNPLTWASLGCAYSAIGSRDKAMRAMQTAAALAPNDRFVLRSHSRLLLLHGDKRHAHDVLARSSPLLYDPWVLSAEIALAGAASRSSRNIREAKRIIDVERFAPNHVSELASALATLESGSANLKRFKKYLALSLERPTENAIAQAAWIGRKLGTSTVFGSLIQGSAEADTWNAVSECRWDLGLRAAMIWLRNQPYSSRPAIMGGEVAGTAMGNFELAIRFYEQGFRTNPDDFSIKNNFAICLAIRGHAARARKVFGTIDRRNLPRAKGIVVMASEGLLCFRSDQVERGRLLYRQAIQDAVQCRDATLEAVGSIELAFEELRIGAEGAEELRQAALQKSEMLTNSIYAAMRNRLRVYQPQRLSASTPMDF